MKDTLYNMENKKIGEVELSDAVFAAPVKSALLYEVVKMQQANKRLGTAASKTRSMVAGSTAKIYRQKGTGRARHGAATANIFVGGGKSFGPHQRDYTYSIPRKAKKAGLRAALSMKKNEGKLVFIDDFSFTKIKTKDAVAALSKMGVKDCLIVIDGKNTNLERSVRNIHKVRTIDARGLNVYDVMRHEHTIITQAALEKISAICAA